MMWHSNESLDKSKVFIIKVCNGRIIIHHDNNGGNGEDMGWCAAASLPPSAVPPRMVRGMPIVYKIPQEISVYCTLIGKGLWFDFTMGSLRNNRIQVLPWTSEVTKPIL